MVRALRTCTWIGNWSGGLRRSGYRRFPDDAQLAAHDLCGQIHLRCEFLVCLIRSIPAHVVRIAVIHHHHPTRAESVVEFFETFEHGTIEIDI